MVLDALVVVADAQQTVVDAHHVAVAVQEVVTDVLVHVLVDALAV